AEGLDRSFRGGRGDRAGEERQREGAWVFGREDRVDRDEEGLQLGGGAGVEDEVGLAAFGDRDGLRVCHGHRGADRLAGLEDVLQAQLLVEAGGDLGGELQGRDLDLVAEARAADGELGGRGDLELAAAEFGREGGVLLGGFQLQRG